MKKGPLHFFRAPIAVVPAMQTGALREAVITALGRGNPEISPEDYHARSRVKTGSFLEATGTKSDYKFDREVSGWWSISDRGGSCSIQVDIPYPKYGWHEDKQKRVEFPAGTLIDDVVAHLIAMIQERQQEAPNGLLAPKP